MGHDRPHSNGSSGILVGVVAIGTIMFVGLFVLGGAAWFYTRQAAVAQEMVVLEKTRAVAAESQARQQAVAAARTREELAESPVRQLEPALAIYHLYVVASGAVRIDHTEVDLDEMIVRLTDGERSVETVVHLDADPQCAFEHIAAVIKKCRAAGIRQIEVAPPTGK